MLYFHFKVYSLKRDMNQAVLYWLIYIQISAWFEVYVSHLFAAVIIFHHEFLWKCNHLLKKSSIFAKNEKLKLVINIGADYKTVAIVNLVNLALI